MEYALRMTGAQHFLLGSHLFPGDGKEAVALLLCGRRRGESRHILTVRKVVPVAHDICDRHADRITWPTSVLDPLLEEAYGASLAIVKVHSHPTGYTAFSEVDDESDREALGGVCSYLDDGLPHASVVMVPHGAMFGRIVTDSVIGQELDLIQVTGDEILFNRPHPTGNVGSFAERHGQAFGKGTASALRDLSAAVVGCSGTGSIVVELLARLGVGKLILVDPDSVEERNLNRILNSGKEDAYLKRPKVEVLARAIARMGLGQEVIPIARNLAVKEAVLAASECDVLFGCMDGVEGRHLLNRIATFYNLPYFDVGVKLDADGKGGIDSIAGAVHYVQPGMSSLLSRGLYSMPQVEAEEIRRTDSAEYERRIGEGYLRGVNEDRPAVISVNMLCASMAINEFLARIHAYRNLPNSEFAYVGVNLSEVQFHREPEVGECAVLRKHVGKGDTEPLLERAALS